MSRPSDRIVYPAILLAGWYVLPSGRARNLYMYTWAATIGGFATMYIGHADDPNRVDHPFGQVNVWSILVWAFALFCLVSLVREVRSAKRAIAAGEAEHPALLVRKAKAWANNDPKPVEIVGPLAEASPANVNAVQVVVTQPAAAPAPAPETMVSKLWIPEPSRRVMRGGETLGGTKFTDRRANDPRNIL